MIVGIGVDAVQISDVEGTIEREGMSCPFITRTFTLRERQEAGARPAEYLAARFAVKEAVFKAIAHNLPEKSFDFRCVESTHREDGSPYVVTEGETGELMRRAGVDELQLSVTTEGDYAIAFVIALGASRVTE